MQLMNDIRVGRPSDSSKDTSPLPIGSSGSKDQKALGSVNIMDHFEIDDIPRRSETILDLDDYFEGKVFERNYNQVQQTQNLAQNFMKKRDALKSMKNNEASEEPESPFSNIISEADQKELDEHLPVVAMRKSVSSKDQVPPVEPKKFERQTTTTGAGEEKASGRMLAAPSMSQSMINKQINRNLSLKEKP